MELTLKKSYKTAKPKTTSFRQMYTNLWYWGCFLVDLLYIALILTKPVSSNMTNQYYSISYNSNILLSNPTNWNLLFHY